MAQIFRGRVRDTTTTTGTGGRVVSGSPLSTYRTFSSVMQVGDTIWAGVISHSDRSRPARARWRRCRVSHQVSGGVLL